MTSSHFMLLPSLACQAQCGYCFGPNRGTMMSEAAFDAALDWMEANTPAGDTLDLIFHGGEPLLPGLNWYQRNLPLLQQRFGTRLKLSMRSNLWMLDDAFCDLFQQYEVSLGTSLDGPEDINDRQRGAGYFARCMAGVRTAHKHGMSVGIICTLTPLSAPFYRQVLDFFADERLNFSVHEAVCALGDAPNPMALLPDVAASLMVNLFNYYLENITRVQISTFDALAKGLSAQNGGICTFGDCLGKYLTIAPDGGIFSCNRYAHHPQWQLGSVFDSPSMDILAQSETWQKLRQRELTVHEDCGDCAHFAYCKGGCPYNAFTGGKEQRDSHCQVYKQLFGAATAHGG